MPAANALGKIYCPNCGWNRGEADAQRRFFLRLLPALVARVATALRRIPRSVVPDVPDRIIAATALYLGLPLVTRDRRLQSAGIQTIW